MDKGLYTAGLYLYKYKVRHIKFFKSLFEQNSMWIGQDLIYQIEKSSEELLK